MIDKGIKIYVAGHNGMVGSSICRALHQNGYTNVFGYSRNEVDLLDQRGVYKLFKDHKPKIVVNATARVGGILANNNYPYQFLMENLQIQNNLFRGIRFWCRKIYFSWQFMHIPKTSSTAT